MNLTLNMKDMNTWINKDTFLIPVHMIIKKIWCN